MNKLHALAPSAAATLLLLACQPPDAPGNIQHQIGETLARLGVVENSSCAAMLDLAQLEKAMPADKRVEVINTARGIQFAVLATIEKRQNGEDTAEAEQKLYKARAEFFEQQVLPYARGPNGDMKAFFAFLEGNPGASSDCGEAIMKAQETQEVSVGVGVKS